MEVVPDMIDIFQKYLTNTNLSDTFFCQIMMSFFKKKIPKRYYKIFVYSYIGGFCLKNTMYFPKKIPDVVGGPQGSYAESCVSISLLLAEV